MHGEAKERRHADRIKAVLLTAEGWHPSQIAQALRLTEETVRQHIQAYVRSEKLTTAYKGEPKLSKDQETALIEHLESFQQMSRFCLAILCIPPRVHR